jgi:hypothetical protein
LVFHRRPKLYDYNTEAKLPQASDAKKNLENFFVLFFAEFLKTTTKKAAALFVVQNLQTSKS